MRRYNVTFGSLLNPKEIRRIAAEDLRKIKGAIERKLTTEPEVFGKPLRFSLFGHRCLRVGDYRVIYHIEKSTVYILRIAHRSVVYRNSV